MLVAEVSSLLVVDPSSLIRTLRDSVQAGRETPERLRFGSPGTGRSMHLLSELFLLHAKVKAVHVPCHGVALSMNDVPGGHMDFIFENVPQRLPQVVSGNPRALAVTSPQGLPALPDAPKPDESGFGTIGEGTGYDLLGPAHLDPPVDGLLAQAVEGALASPESRERPSDPQVDLPPLAADAFASFAAKADARWTETIERARSRQRTDDHASCRIVREPPTRHAIDDVHHIATLE